MKDETIPVLLEGPPICLGDKNVSRAVRHTTTDQVDHVEHIKCPDGPQNDRGGQGWLEHGNGDVDKLLPTIGAIHLSRLIKIPGNAL